MDFQSYIQEIAQIILLVGYDVLKIQFCQFTQEMTLYQGY